jgi:hypothetical protein
MQSAQTIAGNVKSEWLESSETELVSDKLSLLSASENARFS